MHAHIRTQVSPKLHSGLSYINVPVSTTDPSLPPSIVLAQVRQEDIIWEKVIDRTAIEAQILKYNSAAFRTAAESPCGHGIIHDELTFTSLSSSAQHLLSGYVPPEWHNDDTQLKHSSPHLQYRIMSAHTKKSPLIYPLPTSNGASRSGGNQPRRLLRAVISAITRLSSLIPSCSMV
ncbi:hypothetical protein MHU86_12616 [Fragilaria crotonensis]|nr:hypothetical protein MHU86_12616 [Fragilaria crotonensis]